MNEEREDSRRNVVLLTVIAIATMLIVLVGATFAYLASQVNSEGQSNIQAATNAGNDMFLINAGSDMEVYADLDNFYSGSGNQVDNTEATITLQSATGVQVTYTYNAYVTVASNNFEYTSGTCYRKSTEVTGVTQNECTSNSNIWAKTNDGGACFSGTPDVVDGAFSNNEVGCLTDNRNMWVSEDAAELVIDLYKADETISAQATCETNGICVNKLHAIVAGITTQSGCTGDNTWVPAKFQDSFCYIPVATADLTTAAASSNVSLLTNQTISVNNSSKTDYYFAEITLINYNHNQIVNGNKNFGASLTFERVTG